MNKLNAALQKGMQYTPSGLGNDRDAVSSDVPLAVRNSMIAVTAYYKAERRGFVPGGEMENWLAAEVEIEQLLTFN